MKKYLLLLAAFSAAPALATPIVLSGDYVKVGISDYGTLGSNGNNQPGLIHDPTGTGTFNSNMDYISPGVPHDGFSLISDQFGFAQNDNDWISSGFGASSPSLLTGAAANGFDNAATWSGGNNFVNITNSYFFNNGDERILVVTQVTALSDLTNLAFARSVDPDSDSLSHGVPATNNQRGNDLFGVDDFVGSAGAVSGYTLALLNVNDSGFAHTTQINSNCCSNINPYNVLNHNGGDMGLSSTGDHGLNLAYMIGSLATGATATLQYAYAVGERISDTGGGTDPVPGVPEPATWAMLIAGFGIVGVAMRRRREQATRLA